jgi:integrase
VVNAEGLPGWRIRVWDHKAHKRVERWVYGNEADAIVALNLFQKEVGDKVTATTKAPSTVGELANAYLGWYEYREPPTVKNPRGKKRPFPTFEKENNIVALYVLPALGPATKIRTVSHSMCVTAITDLELKNRSAASGSTKETAASTMKKMFKYAVLQGWLTANPAAAVPSMWSDGARKRIQIPSLLQAERTATILDGYGSLPTTTSRALADGTLSRDGLRVGVYGDALRVIALTGLRISEITGLTVDKVDLENRTIAVNWRITESGGQRTAGATMKTSAGDRNVVIIDQALEPLERLLARAKRLNITYLVGGPGGGPLSYRTWRKNLKKARTTYPKLHGGEADFSAHAYRHLCASLMIAAHVDIETVRNQMGHSTVAVTQKVYRHSLNLNQKQLAARLSAGITRLHAEVAGSDDPGQAGDADQ